MGVWDYDVEARTLRWDDRMYRLHGLKRRDGEQPYELWTSALHPGDRARAEQLARDAIENGGRYQTDFRIVRPDGEVRHIRASASVRRNSDGRATRMVGVNFDITEHKLIETELINSNERFAVAAEAAGLGFWDYDIASQSVRWDDQMFRIRGSDPVVGNHYALRLRYVHSDDIARVDEELREAAEGRKTFNSEYRIVTAGGGVQHMKSAASLKLDPTTGAARLIGVSFDITARKQVEEQLVQTNQRFALAADAAESGFWDYDLEARTLRWDDRMYRLYGVDPRVGDQPYDLWASSLHPDDRARAEREVLDAVAGTRKFDTVFRIVLPDGQTRHLRAAATLIRDSKTGAARMFGVNFDITQLKRIERELIVSNERFVLAAEAAGLGFWDFDIETQTSLWDDQMYRLYGLSRSDGLDVSVRRSLLHPDDRARIDEALRDAAAGWRNFESEFRILQADGRVRHLKSAASLKRDGSGRGARLLGVCFDVTERREVQEALEQARDAAEAANRAKTDFLAVMSHEIRTPMNGIMGMNALLLDTELTSRQRKMTETIRDSSNSLLSIIDDILDVSKLESGKIELDEIDFDLVDLIEKTIELFAPRAEQKGLSLSADLRSVSRSALNGDAPRLRQIVLNLVSNAIKFTSMGSVTIRVATTDAGAGRTRVRCEVLDTGTGMNDAAKQRLFKPFHQGDSSISRQFGGTGLGLSICKRLVELMEGRIEVSDRPGGGSVFWFEIVARNAIEGFARPRKDQVDENNASPRARSGRILLAEDNPVNVDVATMILEGAGYEVDVAADGVEAVDAIRRRRYDLVLMDMQMPHLDGLAATREIRAAPSGARLPIVAMTANAMKEDQRRCLEAGMDDYFSKPFSPAILVERVAQWIDRFAMPNPPEAAPEPDAVEAFPVVDLAATEDLVAALPAARFHALLRRSLSGMEGQMEKFARLDPIADVAEIGREAHKLVSSAGTFGARRVQHLAGDLEQACLAGDSAYAEELMRQIVPAAAAAAAELRVRYIARH